RLSWIVLQLSVPVRPSAVVGGVPVPRPGPAGWQRRKRRECHVVAGQPAALDLGTRTLAASRAAIAAGSATSAGPADPAPAPAVFGGGTGRWTVTRPLVAALGRAIARPA